MKSVDITGKRFGRLVAVKFVEKRANNQYWLFKCDCGKEIVCRKNAVTSGGVLSCGCSKRKKKDISNLDTWKDFVKYVNQYNPSESNDSFVRFNYFRFYRDGKITCLLFPIVLNKSYKKMANVIKNLFA